MGPIVCKGLQQAYADRVACQGVGAPYSAGIMDNVQPKGTTAAAIGEATKMFKMADIKCPSSVILFGGYRFVFHPPNYTSSSNFLPTTPLTLE